MEKQEQFLQIAQINQEAEKLEQQINLIDQQIRELEAVKQSIEELAIKQIGSEILTNLGKGIFVKTETKSKELFVNVGRETMIKKTPEETLKIIGEQMIKLASGRENFLERVQDLQGRMNSIIQKS